MSTQPKNDQNKLRIYKPVYYKIHKYGNASIMEAGSSSLL